MLCHGNLLSLSGEDTLLQTYNVEACPDRTQLAAKCFLRPVVVSAANPENANNSRAGSDGCDASVVPHAGSLLDSSPAMIRYSAG